MKNGAVQLIDAGTGNLQSVYNALQNLGARITIVANAAECQDNIKTILPGVGAFRQFVDGLVERGLVEPVLRIARSGVPLLGICVGMQAFFDSGEEMGNTAGLGIIPGTVRRFPERKDFKVPHTGWNEVSFAGSSPLLRGIQTGSYFYFNHSYYCEPVSKNHSLVVTDYILPFSSAVASGNILGVQFHPEKSQKLGQQLLNNFLEM